MTAPLFYVPDPSDGWAPDALVTVAGDEGHHAARVTRVQVGEQIWVSDGAGTRALAEVCGVTAGRVEARLMEVERHDPPAVPLILVQALAKGGRDESAIEMATELGVDAVVPWAARRSVARWKGDKVERGVAKWRNITTAAARQSRRSHIPEVQALHTTNDLVADAASWQVVMLHEDATVPLTSWEPSSDRPVALIVGPEGGIDPAEREQMLEAGATEAVLGPTVLRTSTAGPAALTLLLARTRW